MATQRKIDMIVIHCSDSPQRGDTAADVNDWHIANDWPGIGYHYVIDEFGDVEAGRPEYWTGAHVRGYNQDSLGIMLFGRDKFTESQGESLRRLLLELTRRHEGARVLGHCDLDDRKSCPNFDVRKWCRENGINPG